MKLLVGLGNPGPKYQWTRHNAGFIVLDEIAARAGASWSQESRAKGEIARAVVAGESCILLKPLTFMNLSGQSVGAIARFYKIEAADIVVLHDDVDVPSGSVKARQGGGQDGNNGMRDIIAVMGPEVGRVKLGVGRPPPGIDTADWVLAPLSLDLLVALRGVLVDEALLRIKGLFGQPTGTSH